MEIRPKTQLDTHRATPHSARKRRPAWAPAWTPEFLVARWVIAAMLIVACVVAAGGSAPTAPATADPVAPTRAEATLVSNGSSPIVRDRAALQQYARVTTWYSSYSMSTYVHFKAVDEGGYTVREVLGSDNVDLDRETAYLFENPRRRALVDELRAMMQADGWTELGIDGEWYEYVFGR